MNKLPIDVIFKILSYTYNPQNQPLLEDIRNFYKTRQIVNDIYIEKWKHSTIENYKDWIINDMFIFLNDCIPTMFGYCKKCKDIINRNSFVKNVESYIYYTELKKVDSQINIFFALFTTKEREEFILQEFLMNIN